MVLVQSKKVGWVHFVKCPDFPSSYIQFDRSGLKELDDLEHDSSSSPKLHVLLVVVIICC